MDSTRGGIRVIGFDVDGTLIHNPQEKTVWQIFNKAFIGNDEINRKRFHDFRSGRLTYADWVALDVEDWIRLGIARPQMEELIRSSLSPVAEARETIEQLHQRGYRLAVISGTLNLTLEVLLDGLPFDRVFSNQIYFDPAGRIVGYRATEFDDAGKARALLEVAAEFGCGPEQCAFVGDHWNDLSALEVAGLGIAFCPKDQAVRRQADVVIEQGPLSRLLDFFPEVD